MLLGTMVLGTRGVDLFNMLGMHWPGSQLFSYWQPVTHIFMHANFMHLVFNMYGLWFFGRMLEIVWGGKRFALFYFITAFAGMVLYYATVYMEIRSFDPQLIQEVYERGPGLILQSRAGEPWDSEQFKTLNVLFNIPSMGASGALFGLLGANYVLFGNTRIMFIFIPFTFKIKHFVLVYGLYELYRGVFASAGDNVAHFAHVGGLVAGIILVKYWNKTNRNSFY